MRHIKLFNESFKITEGVMDLTYTSKNLVKTRFQIDKLPRFYNKEVYDKQWKRFVERVTTDYKDLSLFEVIRFSSDYKMFITVEYNNRKIISTWDYENNVLIIDGNNIPKSKYQKLFNIADSKGYKDDEVYYAIMYIISKK